MNSNQEIMQKIREIVVEYTNTHLINDKINTNDVYIVWFCKTLQNWKALASSNLKDSMYFELTYNGDADEIYVDVYRKWVNFAK